MNRFDILKKKAMVLGAAGLLTFGTMMTASVPVFAAPETVTAIAERSNVRASSVDGAILFAVSSGQGMKVTAEETGSDGKVWYKVSATIDGAEHTGWIRSDLVKEGAAATEDIQAQEPQDVVAPAPEAEPATAPEGDMPKSVKSLKDQVNVRSTAVNGGLVFALNTGDVVSVVDMATGSDGKVWYQVTSTVQGQERKGWVRSDMVEAVDASDSTDAAGEAAGGDIVMKAGEKSITLINAPESEQVSDRYQMVDFTADNGETILAYQLANADDMIDAGADYEAFYFVYGYNDNDEYGWYVYNADEKSLQKNVTSLSYHAPEATEEAPAEENAPAVDLELDGMSKMIMAGLGVICILLLILAIVFSARYRSLRRYFEEEDAEMPEEEFDDFEEIAPAKKEKKEKKEKKAAKSEKQEVVEKPEKPAKAAKPKYEEQPAKPVKAVKPAKKAVAEDEDDEFVSLQSILNEGFLKELEKEDEQLDKVAEDKRRIQEKIHELELEDAAEVKEAVPAKKVAIDDAILDEIQSSLAKGISADTVALDSVIPNEVSPVESAPAEPAPIKPAPAPKSAPVVEKAPVKEPEPLSVSEEDASDWDDLEFL